MTRQRVSELTGKHLLKLASVLESTNLLQLRDHATLTVIRSRSSIDQTRRQFLLVELLEDILVIDEFEDLHLTHQRHSFLWTGRAYSRSQSSF